MEHLRTCVFRPYGKGPAFKLDTWTTGRSDARGQSIIAYRLRSHGETLFEGADFSGSPLHADDSDATMRSLMSFMTLRPGDTDADYFANYTPVQLEFCEQHAEALSLEVMDRFGED